MISGYVMAAEGSSLKISQALNYTLCLERGWSVLPSELIRAARALLWWDQKTLAGGSAVSLATVKRLEGKPGVLGAHQSTENALRQALEAAGVDFIPENGGGAGVRLRKVDPT